MIMSVCFLTNHSRAALREAGLRETLRENKTMLKPLVLHVSAVCDPHTTLGLYVRSFMCVCVLFL